MKLKITKGIKSDSLLSLAIKITYHFDIFKVPSTMDSNEHDKILDIFADNLSYFKWKWWSDESFNSGSDTVIPSKRQK